MREPVDKNQRFRIDWDKTVELEQIVCPANSEHKWGGKRITDLSVVLKKRQTFDVMWTWGSECLIQPRILDAFQQQGFTGFQVNPVHARFKRHFPSAPPRFWELVITGWAGLASPESGIQLDSAKSCRDCGKLRYTKAVNYSKIIDERNWDGSDFFIVWPLPKFIFVTDRVREFVQKNDIRLTHFVRPEDLQPKTSFEQRVEKGFGPGRLSYWMPEDRAHQLGDPLGIS